MKIRTIFAGAAVAIGGIGAVAGVTATIAAWSALSQQRAAGEVSAAFSRMLLVPERLAMERAGLTRAITPPEPTAAQRAFLAEARQAFDQSIAAARSAVETVGVSPLELPLAGKRNITCLPPNLGGA